jgi:aldose 1-epimerase
MKRLAILVIVLAVSSTLWSGEVFGQILRRDRTQRNKGAVMSIEKSDFGKTLEGQQVEKYNLGNGTLSVEVLNFGGVIYSFNVPDKNGNVANISANYETVAEYQKVRPFFGSLVGRYANRIAKGKFTLDGKEYTLPINNEPNALHGGLKGFDQVIWNVKELHSRHYAGLELTYTAKDGEEGYPGNISVKVVYKLDDKNAWTMDYTATTDKKTVLNLTNHTFWNLAGYVKGETPSNHDHVLTINADRFLPTDNTLIPTGELQAAEGTPLDFRTAHKIGERIAEIKGDHFSGGYDHCFVLNKRHPSQPFRLTHCADVYDPKSGRSMKIETTEPGVQFYSGNFLDGSTSANGVKYVKHAAFCLETNHYPNSPNEPKFPSTVLEPGKIFRSTTVHTFGIKQ